MVLTDESIRKLSAEKHLIDPFNESNLQSESYDLTVGDKVVSMGLEGECLDVSDQDRVDLIYKEETISENGYVIQSNGYVLVSINEKISLTDDITAHLRPRTRYTRLGLIVVPQHCNSTYSGHLRVGVYNAAGFPIRIYKGIAIVQIVFEELEAVPTYDKLYKNKKDGYYHNENGKFRGAKFDDDLLQDIWRRMLKKNG